MRIHLIIIALLISAVSASSQNAHISIHVPGNGSGHVAYQRLDKYSFVDSVALDSDGRAALDVECEEEYQFFRLILGQQKLPMILQKGENVAVELNTGNITESRIDGSPNTEYLLSGIQHKDNISYMRKTIKKNPYKIANIFLVEYLDFSKDFKTYQSVAYRFKDLGIPAASNLYYRVEASQRIKDELQKPEYQPYKTIIFWAAWNKSSIEFLDKYIQEHPGEGILAISMDGNRELYEKTIKQLSIAKDAAVKFKCELNYFNNEYARIFMVTELPMLIEH